ncbi:uncharacterized protein METZ01_LOCUS377016, partial [marine metagenome]
MLGILLETMHGLKIRMYLDVSNETRRLMWTLAHAHGSLLGLIHLILGLCLRIVPEIGSRHLRMISTSLIMASVFLPGGFFLGGIVVYGGDPGLGILAVPIGAALLVVAIYKIALGSATIETTTSTSGKTGRWNDSKCCK